MRLGLLVIVGAIASYSGVAFAQHTMDAIDFIVDGRDLVGQTVNRPAGFSATAASNAARARASVR